MLELAAGDITAQRVDAIVNAANTSLLGGGGVDGAIHRKGGPEILAACRALRAGHLGKGLKTGQAVATTAGRLPATWVIHTVGPVWSATEDRSATLRACYTNSLAVAAGLGARSIAFPLLSSGVYRWPKDDAVRHALAALRHLPPGVDLIRLVLFDEPTLTPSPNRSAPPPDGAVLRRWASGLSGNGLPGGAGGAIVGCGGVPCPRCVRSGPTTTPGRSWCTRRIRGRLPTRPLRRGRSWRRSRSGG
jgi:O-acetyl-ADP-ribose deacetylase (regulator of RNase III)